jgi:hypothetical protein
MISQQNLLRIGMKWEEDEVRYLLTSIKNHKSISDIAIEHQRTEKAIKFKIEKLADKYFLEDFKLIEATFQDTPEHLKMELKNEIRKKYQENFAAFLELDKN